MSLRLVTPATSSTLSAPSTVKLLPIRTLRDEIAPANATSPPSDASTFVQ